MRPLHLWLVVLAFLALLPPWACRGELGARVVLGLPLWAVASLGVAVVFAGVTVWGITRHWDALAGDSDAGGDPDGP